MTQNVCGTIEHCPYHTSILDIVRQPPTNGGTFRSFRPEKWLSIHPSKPFPRRFHDPTHYYTSTPPPHSYSLRSWLHILLLGDIHPNPGLTAKYPSLVCARNGTSRGVNYLCNRSEWVHSKCSGLQNASENRQIKDWVCSSPPTLPKSQPLPPTIPNTNCRWEFIHHHAIQRKWHRQQTD